MQEALYTSSIVVRECQEADVTCLLARGLRFFDTQEAEYFVCLQAEEALYASIVKSKEAYSVYLEEQVSAIFGIVACPLACGRKYGVPWFVAHSDVEKKQYQYAFAKRAKAYVRKWQKEYVYLENYTLAAHKRAVHFLRWLGFSLVQSKNNPFSKSCIHFFISQEKEVQERCIGKEYSFLSLSKNSTC